MGVSRRSHATPSTRRQIERWTALTSAFLVRHRIRIAVDTVVASIVLSLPLGVAVGQATSRAHQATTSSFAPPSAEVARARTVSRSSTITAARDPQTTVAEDVRPIVQYTLSKADTLATLANFFGISAEAIAFANGITDPGNLEAGRTIMIPPGEGALYAVQAADTVESVAQRFTVDPKVIMEYNRLYFEPEHFAPGQLIFVRGAALPGLVYAVADKEEEVEAPAVVARPAPAPVPAPAPARSAGLLWPVGGRITQYFWAFHTGVDIAAPYGTGVGASDGGTVVSAGWVSVGGLSVRIKHPSGIETGYYHLGAVFVAPGAKVARGQIIGTIGMTGVTTGPHVHWETKLAGRFVNPLAY